MSISARQRKNGTWRYTVSLWCPQQYRQVHLGTFDSRDAATEAEESYRQNHPLTWGRGPVVGRHYVVDDATGCWEWIRKTNPSGYGYCRNPQSRRLEPAHRVVYQLKRGSIPDGLQLDHLCRNRRCVNPEHLEPVTPKENIRRGWRARRAAASQ